MLLNYTNRAMIKSSSFLEHPVIFQNYQNTSYKSHKHVNNVSF